VISNKTLLRISLVLGVVAAVLSLAGCSGGKEASAEPVATVQVANVKQAEIQRVVSGEGVVYARQQATIVPKISAPVSKYYVTRGSRVHAGQLLAELENSDLKAALIQSQGAYEQAQAAYATSIQMNIPAQLQAAQQNLEVAREAMKAQSQAYESDKKLFQQGALARKLLDDERVLYTQARNQYAAAEQRVQALKAVGHQAQIQTAKAQLTAAEGAYMAAKARMSYSEIRSPIDGVVASSPLYIGEMASAGTPLLTVVDASSVIVRLYLTPQQAALLHPGDPAVISLNGGQVKVAGKVTVVSPALDPNSTTVQVWVEAPNPHDELKPGSAVTVSMVAETVPHALVIPASAIINTPDQGPTVMLVGSDSRAHQTPVKTGISNNGEIQVLSGLHAGDTVITQGGFGLDDNTKVQVATGSQGVS